MKSKLEQSMNIPWSSTNKSCTQWVLPTYVPLSYECIPHGYPKFALMSWYVYKPLPIYYFIKMGKIDLLLDRISKSQYNTPLTENKLNPKRCKKLNKKCLILSAQFLSYIATLCRGLSTTRSWDCPCAVFALTWSIGLVLENPKELDPVRKTVNFLWLIVYE